MRKSGLYLAFICVLAGCAEQQVTENSKYIALTTDSFTKGQVLANIGKFIEDAGALPAMGHLKGGTAQFKIVLVSILNTLIREGLTEQIWWRLSES